MPLDVRVLRWHAVAAWTWDAGDDVCGICRNPFDGCPPDGKMPGDESPVVWGTCAHAFHLQCIQKWLGTQQEQRCPICRRTWEFKAAVAATGAEEGQQQQQQGTPGGGPGSAMEGDGDLAGSEEGGEEEEEQEEDAYMAPGNR